MQGIHCRWCNDEVYAHDGAWRHITGLVSCVVGESWLPGTFADPTSIAVTDVINPTTYPWQPCDHSTANTDDGDRSS